MITKLIEMRTPPDYEVRKADVAMLGARNDYEYDQFSKYKKLNFKSKIKICQKSNSKIQKLMIVKRVPKNKN